MLLAPGFAVRWVRALVASAAIVWLVFPAGCDFPSCKSDLDCPAHQVCDWLACSPGCRNEDCAKGSICKPPRSLPAFRFVSRDEYSCQPGCSKDTDCGVRFLCNTDGYCVCEDDAACGAGHICVAGACECNVDTACGTGNVCEQGTCRCATSEGCGAGRACAKGYCWKQCRADTDCAAGNTCVDTATALQPDAGSEVPRRCASGQTCICQLDDSLLDRSHGLGDAGLRDR